MSAHEETWEGGYRRYDLVKEFVIALVVVTLLSLALAFVFSSPDEQPVTFRAWSQADAKDFVATAVTELNGSSEVAQYGPPYTNTPDAAQKIGPISLQAIPGVRIPIDTAQAFVIGPLQTEANDEAVATALEEYLAASPIQRAAWTDAYAAGLDTATISEGKIAMPAGSGDAGPVAVMMQEELRLAQSGGLDGALLTTKQFYQTDYTKPVLFMGGGGYFEDKAAQLHLLGEQWGMMNETGNWPGQAWLWLYTFWYQIPPYSTSGNADAQVWAIMMVLTLVLVLVPFIPGLRTLPRRLGMYRLIWRDYYRAVERR